VIAGTPTAYSGPMRYLLAAALALSATAAWAQPEEGTFWAEVSGALQSEGGGDAVARLTRNGSGERGFKLELSWPSASGEPNRLEIWRALVALPRPGRYPLVSAQQRTPRPEEFRVRYHRVEPLPVTGMTLRLRSGSVTLERCDPRRVSGTFEIEIAAHVPGEAAERPVVISGRFDAPLE